MPHNRIVAAEFLLVLSFALSLTTWARAPLTFEERVKAQEAIERVYYNHRIWPKENPQPKPPFEETVSKADLEAKVRDYLKKSASLDGQWERPVTAQQIQDEMDRMARETRDPATLRELFTALGNDPYLIAECLVLPTMAESRLNTAYSWDTRQHWNLRSSAEKARLQLASLPFETYPEGQYLHIRFTSKRESSPQNAPGTFVVSDEELARLIREADEQGASPVIQETEEAFVVYRNLPDQSSAAERELRLFPKTPFGIWWEALAKEMPVPSPRPYHSYRLPAIAANRIETDPACQDAWTSNRFFFPTERTDSTAVWTGTEMIIWGGNYLNTGARYNPATQTWRPMSFGANCPLGRSKHKAIWTGTEMIIWGGITNSGYYPYVGGRYNPVSDTWQAVTAGTYGPSGRTGHTLVWTGAEMIVWGGSSCSPQGARYTPSNDTWAPMADAPIGCRSGHTAVWTDTEMIVWGGCEGGCQIGGRYNPASNSWTPTSTTTGCPPAGYGHTAVWTGTEMIVWGGFSSSYGWMKLGGRYNPLSDSWVATSTDSPCPIERRYHTAVWTGTSMIIWGGYSPWTPITGGAYFPDSNSWTAVSEGVNSPTPRSGHSAIWTGTEMIIWGGGYRTGGIFNPFLNSWRPEAPGIGDPSGRSGHTAIWTGNEMIVWGGNSNTGGCYLPAIDTWTPTNTGSNCPYGRSGHTAIWTGTRMIIWGGYYPEGGQYSPITDSWLPTSSGTNSPSARSFNSAVWTGQEMIIWGGYNGNFLSSGGRYNPGTDIWTPMSALGPSPSIRRSHSAAWTGLEMVIWGGTNNGYWGLNDGSAYNPLTDSWRAIASVGAPIGRSEHSATFTGTEMLVWGGFYEDSAAHYLGDGGLYDPTRDAWRPFTLSADTPSGRKGHTAVWDGQDVLIWGGYNGTGQYPTGVGRYNPIGDVWFPVVQSSASPTPRWAHTAVWTGNSMIVWGGYGVDETSGNLTDLSTGGIFILGYRPPIITGKTAECIGTPVTLSTGSYDTYQWQRDGSDLPGETGPVLTVSQEGNYTVKTMTGICEYTSPIHPLNYHGPAEPTIVGDNLACTGGGGISLSTQEFATYQWIRDGVDIPGANSRTYLAATSGAYQVRALDLEACGTGLSPVHDVTIMEYPTPEITGNFSACQSSGALLSTGVYSTYQWYMSYQTYCCWSAIPGATSNTYLAQNNCYYYVQVTNAAGCSGSSGPIYVSMYGSPSPTIYGPSPACITASLSTSTYSAYQWYWEGIELFGFTSRTFEAPGPGSYTVKVTDSNGCQGLSSPFVVGSYPTPQVAGPASACGSASLSTGDFGQYQWYKDGSPLPGATGKTLLVTETGQYSVRVVNSTGCEGTSAGHDIVIALAPTPAITGLHYNTCPQVSVTLSTDAYDVYQWKKNGVAIPGATGQQFEVSVTGSYSVQVTHPNGCQSESGLYLGLITFCPDSEISPPGAVFPARLVRSPLSSTGFYLYCQKLEALDGLNVYEGTIGAWYSHANAPGNRCNLAFVDLGTGEMRAELTPSEGDHYYLITGFASGVQGPSGYDSSKNRIPITQSTCAP